MGVVVKFVFYRQASKRIWVNLGETIHSQEKVAKMQKGTNKLIYKGIDEGAKKNSYKGDGLAVCACLAVARCTGKPVFTAITLNNLSSRLQ